jgi:hypothetical protein
MALKILAALVAMVLVIAYLVPVVLKLKEISLGVVILLGIVMMLVDMWQSLKSNDT